MPEYAPPGVSATAAGRLQRGRSWPRFRRRSLGTARTQFERTWHNLQTSSPVFSSDGARLVVEGRTFDTADRPGDAQVTSAAIDQVVQAVRTDRPLTR